MADMQSNAHVTAALEKAQGVMQKLAENRHRSDASIIAVAILKEQAEVLELMLSGTNGLSGFPRTWIEDRAAAFRAALKELEKS